MKPRKHVEDLRGASRLAVEATRGVTALVEAMHRKIAGGPDLLHRAFTAPVYATVRGVAQVVGVGIDMALARLAPLLGESAPGPERDALLAALNGVLGDYLKDTGNPLAIEMELTHDGHALELTPEALRRALPNAGGKMLVLIHGSSMSDRQWRRRGHDHGAVIAAELGFTAVYVRYNSGLHVSTNGRDLAGRLEQLVAAWPVPLEELAILAHSMGGLVARSACHAGDTAGHAWRRSLRKLVCLGTPHHGAPLERAGNWVDLVLGVSAYSAPLARLGKIRSAGVTDLRFGNVLDEHWEGRDRFAHGSDARTPLPLPEGVACHAIAGTVATKAADGKLPSDGLVPVDSALGRHARPELTLHFPEAHQHIAFGTGHLDLLDRPEVLDRVRSWLT